MRVPGSRQDCIGCTRVCLQAVQVLQRCGQGSETFASADACPNTDNSSGTGNHPVVRRGMCVFFRHK